MVVIFLDAFRYDYVTEANSSFLFHLAKEGHRAKIKPMLGYSSGITASLWTGTFPQTHGDWFYWGHVRDRPGWNPPIFDLFKIFPKGKIRLIAKHGLLYFLTKTGSPARAWFMPAIPDESLPYFTKLGNDFNPHTYVCQVPTFFDFLDKKNIPYRWTDLSSWDASSICPMLGEKDNKNAKSNFFVDVFSSAIFDKLGHMYGPSSSRVSLEISKLDNFLKDLITKFESKVEDLNVVIIADHGMALIREKFDVQSRIHALPLVLTKDYLEFYDSTVARFWAFNEKSKLMLTETLRTIPNGRIVEKNELQKSGLLFGDGRYGDIIFQMNEGLLIFPNYFTSIIPKFVRTAKGMHGYDGANSSQKALFCYYGRKSRGLKNVEEMETVDILSTLFSILGIPIPSSLEGKSQLN